MTNSSNQNLISTYLKKVYETFKLRSYPPGKPIYLVLGNESADMDSIASALTYSYANQNQGFHIPMINILKSELYLRPHVEDVFQELKIDSERILYKDNIPALRSLAYQQKLRLILVDHNKLAPTQEFFSPYVETVIDHHKEEEDFSYHSVYPNLKNKQIKAVGSNSSLIAESILKSDPSHMTFHMTSEIAFLLQCAILLDTKNFQKDNVQALDYAMAKKLTELSRENQEALYQRLTDLQNNINHFSASEMLKLDFKTYRANDLLYGIARVKRDFDKVADRKTWENAFKELIAERNIHLLSALVSIKVEKKDFWVVHANKASLHEAVKGHKELGKCICGSLSNECLSFFSLEDGISRKSAQPCIQKYLSEIGNSH